VEVEEGEGGEGDGGTGVVVMDWVGQRGDWDIVKAVIGMNEGVVWRGRKGLEDGEGDS
jgi:1-phosphatidylinositol phosphodiesterase